MFAKMMQHFGSAVKAIQGNWSYGTNLAKVNELTRGGTSHLSLGDAMRLGGFQVFSDGGSDDVSLDQDLARIIATTRDSWIDRVGG